LDIVVLLHGDGQYAPEIMQDLLDPLETGQADMVMGSRMMVPGAARKGNMPLYKYLGNKVLTFTENVLAGTNLTEFHSGYRAYSVQALREIPLDAMTPTGILIRRSSWNSSSGAFGSRKCRFPRTMAMRFAA
jgi:hypothetical protein